MSLQVWLPLNGDLHNQGLSNIIMINNGATVNNDGKIGKCYYFNTSSYLTENNYNWTNFNTTEFSLCCWYKQPSPVASGNSQIICIGTNSGWNNIRIGLLRRTSSGYPMFSVSNGTSAVQYNCTATTFSFDTWNHIACTYKNGEIKIYLNGKLDKTYTTTIIPVLNSSQHLGIGAASNGAEKLTGYLNDVRIYDHALSAKEVEGISKGLILHYKLDNDGFGNENYWGDGKPLTDGSGLGELMTGYSRSNRTYASALTSIPNEYIEIKFLSTRTPIDDGGIQLQKLQRLNETFNSMCPILEHLKTGEQLTISYELYITSPIKIRFHLIKTLNGTSTKIQPDIDSIQVSTLNAWTKVSQSIEIPSSFDESNITTESVLGVVIGIREILGTTSSGEVTIRIRNIKLEKGQVATNWTPARADFGHIDDNVIYDYSGYGNNGTIVGSLETVISSPRYSYATKFDGSSRITHATLPSIYTLSCWCKTDKNKSTSQFMVADSGSNMCISFFNGTIIGVFGTTRSTGSKCTLGSEYKENDWNHIVVVKTSEDGKRDIYCNGVKLTPAANDYWSATTGFWVGARNSSQGNPFYGNIADVRAYATALTAEQVKELYQTSTTIDKNSNIYARELVEI